MYKKGSADVAEGSTELIYCMRITLRGLSEQRRGRVEALIKQLREEQFAEDEPVLSEKRQLRAQARALYAKAKSLTAPTKATGAPKPMDREKLRARSEEIRAELAAEAASASKAAPPTSETVFYGPLLTQTAESIGRTPQEVLEHIVSKKEAELRLTQVEVDILFDNTTSD